MNRRGVTLIELLVAMVVMGLVFTAAITFLQQQGLAFSLGTGSMTVLQNHRFAMDVLEENIRTAGTGVQDAQPFLVYADRTTIAFNADYSTNDPADPFAVYVDLGAPDDEVGALTRARRFTLPSTSFVYPDSTYRDGGVTSSAETIIFYFAPDVTTSRGDDFVLYRKVNDLDPEVVARNLLRTPDTPFFEYQELVTVPGAASTSNWIPESDLPLRHAIPVHLGPDDTGAAARIDGIRAVRVNFTATNGEEGDREQSRAVTRLIGMPNAGRATLKTCGDGPLFTSTVTATQVPGEMKIEIAWSRSTDEVSGEGDVVRYAIYRRTAPETSWGEPYFSLPAGNPTYLYSDPDVAVGQTYTYAVAAQDCTPTMSGLRVSSPVTVAP